MFPSYITNSTIIIVSSCSSSIHPMQTCCKFGIMKPHHYHTLLLTVVEPTTVKQALSSPIWCKAVQVECDALLANNTWSLTFLPPGRTAIGCKWVFRIKENSYDIGNRYKAQLMAKVFHKKFGCDYFETLSPAIKPVTICIVLTLAIKNHLSH